MLTGLLNILNPFRLVALLFLVILTQAYFVAGPVVFSNIPRALESSQENIIGAFTNLPTIAAILFVWAFATSVIYYILDSIIIIKNFCFWLMKIAYCTYIEFWRAA